MNFCPLIFYQSNYGLANETRIETLLLKHCCSDRYQLLPNEQFIVHLDMDCFFVSVGLLSRPHLQCKAVAVTHHLTSTSSLHAKRPGTDVDYERNYYRRKMNENGASAGKEEHSGYAAKYWMKLTTY